MIRLISTSRDFYRHIGQFIKLNYSKIISIIKIKRKMIELKIPVSTAVMLITERMKLEFALRKKAKLYHPESTIFTLNYNDLLNLAEISAVDLVFFLPAGIHYETNNLAYILCKAMRQLAGVFNCIQFNEYSIERAQRLIRPAQKLFQSSENNKAFLNN